MQHESLELGLESPDGEDFESYKGDSSGKYAAHESQLWVGMPEFVQEKVEPYAKIIFRFECESDLQEFAGIIGQKLTTKTKSSWHPFKPHRVGDERSVWKDAE